MKVISATIKMILATDEVFITTLKVITATTIVILATEDLITTGLKAPQPLKKLPWPLKKRIQRH